MCVLSEIRSLIRFVLCFDKIQSYWSETIFIIVARFLDSGGTIKLQFIEDNLSFQKKKKKTEKTQDS